MTEFDEIRPFEKGEMKAALESLLADRQFNAMLKGFAPWLPKAVRNGLLRLLFIGVETPLEFQKRFMAPVVRYVERKCSDGVTFKGRPLPDKEGRYVFLSNHRDIVLDSAILDLELFKADYPTTVEIGIGDNLLIYPWIKTLVKMNKAFTVKRGLSPRQLVESSQLMSRYIHYAINEKRENVWIAQREGRAKDSDDRTQASVLKMLAMGAPLNPPLRGETEPKTQNSAIAKLWDLNIVPLTISYEFDPCDYLKAKEFQQKRDNPAFKKSKKDDLDNMKTGIWGYKGRVVYECAPCVNEWLKVLEDVPQTEIYNAIAERIDKEIHRGYTLFPCNYIALDRLNGDNANADKYTTEDIDKFDKYLKGQLEKIDLPNKDVPFLTERILTMYANPARNKMATGNKD